MGFHDSHVPHVFLCSVSKVEIKVSHSVVAVGTVGGGGAKMGGGAKVVTHNMNFCNFFNLISHTISSSIPGLETYFRFSFRFFKKGSCQLLAKVCARNTG